MGTDVDFSSADAEIVSRRLLRTSLRRRFQPLDLERQGPAFGELQD